MASPIPVDVGELTAGWLTEIFQAHCPGARIEQVEVLEASSGTTGRARLRLEGDDRLPPSVFVKLAPFTAERRQWVIDQGMGVAEARFYDELRSDIDTRTPGCWHASYDADGRYVMVLEDLVAAGAEVPPTAAPDIGAFAGQVMDAFASYHASFHASPRFGPGGDLTWVEERSRGYGSAAPLVRQAVEVAGDEMPPVFHELASLYMANADTIAGLLTHGERTLVHGDAHIGNMLSSTDGPVLLDWAVVGCGPGIRDVAYFIGTSVPTEIRRSQEEALLERYLVGLATQGVEIPHAEAWPRYRLHLITAWVAAVVTVGFGDALQPLEISLRAAERANTAIGDLDVIPLLRSALP